MVGFFGGFTLAERALHAPGGRGWGRAAQILLTLEAAILVGVLFYPAVSGA